MEIIYVDVILQILLKHIFGLNNAHYEQNSMQNNTFWRLLYQAPKKLSCFSPIARTGKIGVILHVICVTLTRNKIVFCPYNPHFSIYIPAKHRFTVSLHWEKCWENVRKILHFSKKSVFKMVNLLPIFPKEMGNNEKNTKISRFFSMIFTQCRFTVLPFPPICRHSGVVLGGCV